MYTPTDSELDALFNAAYEKAFVATQDEARARAAGLRKVFDEAFQCLKKKAYRDEPHR